MSGIGAIFRRDGREVSPREAQAMARALAVHGPDREDLHLDGAVALVHRLFADTPEARLGRQPVEGAGGRRRLLFDGRLDNREDLARALDLDAAELAGLSDAALAMRSWDRWGEDAPERWIGPHAAILWDEADQALTALRDPLGRRLLTWWETPELFAIATAPKGLHALPEIPRRLDRIRFAQALTQHYGDAERSWYEGVRRLPPCGRLRVDRRSLRLGAGRRLADRVRDVTPASEAACAEEAHALLDQAVRARLRGAQGAGLFLSGGLDSSTLAVKAAAQLGAARGPLDGPLHGLLHGYVAVPGPDWDGRVPRGWYGDETPSVRALAARVPNLRAQFVDAADLPLDHREAAFLHCAEAPRRNVVSLAWMHAIFERARGDGVSVLLNGYHGDFTLSHEGSGLLLELWRAGRLGPLLRELRAGGAGPGRIGRRLLGELVFPLLPARAWRAKERLRGRHGEGSRRNWPRASLIHAAFAREAEVERWAAPGPGGLWQGEQPPADLRLARIRAIEEYAAEGAEFSLGMSSLHGVALRDPYSDLRLLEWSLGLPEAMHRRDGRGRRLIRRMMADALPPEILDRPPERSRGMQSADWHARLSRELPALRAWAARQREGAAERELDLDAIEAMLDAWPSQTVIDGSDDARFRLRTVLPMSVQATRFAASIDGRNA